MHLTFPDSKSCFAWSLKVGEKFSTWDILNRKTDRQRHTPPFKTPVETTGGPGLRIWDQLAPISAPFILYNTWSVGGGKVGWMKGFFARYNTRPCDCQKRKLHFLFYGTAGQNSICFLVNLAGDQTESEKKKERHSGDWNMESRKGFSAVPRFMVLKKIKIKIEAINLSNLSWARVIVPKGLHALLSENTLYTMVSNLHIGKISLENFSTKNNYFI